MQERRKQWNSKLKNEGPYVQELPKNSRNSGISKKSFNTMVIYQHRRVASYGYPEPLDKGSCFTKKMLYAVIMPELTLRLTSPL